MWLDLQFKIQTEWQMFEKIFMANLFTLRVFARNLAKKKIYSIFVLLETSDLRFEPWPLG